jgi:hypothetical protein
MPTAREFENAAIEYCLDRSSVGVWAMHLEQVDLTIYDITVRMGGHYRADTGGVATIRVTYHPLLQRYTCQPADAILPELAAMDDAITLYH